MKSDSVEQLWSRLLAAGLVSGEPGSFAGSHSPWYVRVMLGISGWLAALFLLGFVGMAMAFVMRSGEMAIIAGVAACGGAALIFASARDNDFASQFGLAVSFAGQFLFIWGAAKILHGGSSAFFLAIAAFEAVLVGVIGNMAHRVVSAFASAICFGMALFPMGFLRFESALMSGAFVFVWLNELAWAHRGSLVRPVGYGLVLATLFFNGMLFFPRHLFWGGAATGGSGAITLFYWAGAVLSAAVFLYAVSRLLLRQGIGLREGRGVSALVIALAISISAFKAPGILTGLLVVLLGYANGNRTLTGLGIFSLVAYLFYYYYQLEATLLVKSVSLVVTGIVLLTGRFMIQRRWPQQAIGGDVHA